MILPIRSRLTLWYSTILLVALFAFGATIYFSVRSVLLHSVDTALSSQITGIQNFLRREVPRFERSRLPQELAENVLVQAARTSPDLEPIGGEMLQISDLEGHWLCQSRSMAALNLAAPRVAGPQTSRTITMQQIPFRLRSEAVTIDGQIFLIQVAETLMPVRKAIRDVQKLLLVFIPAIVLLAALSGYGLSQRALAPVDAIIKSSRAIDDRNLSQRLPVPQSHDELQRLSETLNEMIERLDQAFHRTERFTADASHELRSPVALIRTTAEVALLMPREPDYYRLAFSKVLAESESMTTLIQALLTLARSDSNAGAAITAETNLSEVLRIAVGLTEPEASAKKIEFEVDLTPEDVIVLGDAAMLLRLLRILLENAVKYTHSGGQVGICIESRNGTAHVQVRDTGIGIAEEELPLIFERFFRSDKARQREDGGVGLGLSIAAWIAEAHRTRINVESRVGTGSIFSIALPMPG